jgi:site-specific recombinase XerD
MRHALATELLASGVALSDISQVLRHRDLATTAIYAKVDFASLRGVAREWPGATR